jgi:hypothetical protein
MEFVYPSAEAALFDKLIATMTRDFSYDERAPRIEK